MQEKIDDVKQIISLFENSKLQTLELEIENFKIKLEAKKLNEKTEVKIENKKENGRFIESPLVGTFYSRPNPNSKSFIEVGQYIKKGEPLFIIEAMKVMNEIKADQDGTILEILVKDGAVVDFGAPIIRLGD